MKSARVEVEELCKHIRTEEFNHLGVSKRLGTSTLVATVLLIVVAAHNEVLSFGERCGTRVDTWYVVEIHGSNASPRGGSHSLWKSR